MEGDLNVKEETDNNLQYQQDIQNGLQDMKNINWKKKMEDVDEQDVIQNDLHDMNNLNWNDVDDWMEEDLMYDDVVVEDQEDLLYDDVEEDHDTNVQHQHDFLRDVGNG
jgi:hypothetical protein